MDFSSSYSLVASAVAHWPTDWILIGALVAFVALDTIRSGSNRACALALALPIASILFSLVPHTFILEGVLKQFGSPLAQAICYVVLLVGVYILVHRMLFMYGDSSGSPLPALMTGAALAALFTVFWLQEPALGALWTFGDQVHLVFAESYRALWLLAGYALLAYSRS